MPCWAIRRGPESQDRPRNADASAAPQCPAFHAPAEPLFGLMHRRSTSCSCCYLQLASLTVGDGAHRNVSSGGGWVGRRLAYWLPQVRSRWIFARWSFCNIFAEAVLLTSIGSLPPRPPCAGWWRGSPNR